MWSLCTVLHGDSVGGFGSVEKQPVIFPAGLDSRFGYRLFIAQWSMTLQGKLCVSEGGRFGIQLYHTCVQHRRGWTACQHEEIALSMKSHNIVVCEILLYVVLIQITTTETLLKPKFLKMKMSFTRSPVSPG